MTIEILNHIKSQTLQEIQHLINFYVKNNCIYVDKIESVFFAKYCSDSRKFLTINFKKISVIIYKNLFNYSIIIKLSKNHTIKLLKYVDYDSTLPLFFDIFESITDDKNAKEYAHSKLVIDTLNNLLKYRLNAPQMYNTTCILLSACILFES